jgi:ribosome recycling factor
MGEGQIIRVPLPELNTERRRELTKVAHNYAEQARVAVRHIRRDGMDALKKAEKDGDMSQDDARVQSDLVQKATDVAVADIDSVLIVKEQEIMQVAKEARRTTPGRFRFATCWAALSGDRRRTAHRSGPCW